MFCPHCGAELPHNAVFCGYCGKPLPTPPEPPTDNAAPDASMDVQAAGVDAADKAPVGEGAVQAEHSASTGMQEASAVQGELSGKAESPAQAEPPASAEDQAECSPLAGAAVEPAADAPVELPAERPDRSPAQEDVSPDEQGPLEVPAKKRFPATRLVMVGVAIVTAAVVIAIIAAVTGSMKGGTAGLRSAQAVADRVTELYNALLTSDFDAPAFEDFGEGVLDLMPPDVIDAALEDAGYTREEEIESLGSGLGGAMQAYGSLLSEYTDSFTISIATEPGDALTDDDLADINDDLADLNFDGEATEGCELEGTVIMTFTSDFMTYHAGDEESQDVGSIGLAAINIDGGWYLWPSV